MFNKLILVISQCINISKHHTVRYTLLCQQISSSVLLFVFLNKDLFLFKKKNTAAAALSYIYIPLISETDSAGPLSVKGKQD